jgi:predicted Rossmann fold nucleotide-binding protein DprA/Smf involved in DNA uptake
MRRLDIREAVASLPPTSTSLEQRVLAALHDGPYRLDHLRATVGARKQSVAHTLKILEASGHVVRRPEGWQLALPLS